MQISFNSSQAGHVIRRTTLIVVMFLYLILWVGGVTHHWMIGEMNTDKNWLATAFLFLAGLSILINSKSVSDFFTFAGVGLAGFTVELIGVHTGVPFGSYSYSDVLKPQLFGVPPAMAFAWIILVAYIKQIVPKLNAPMWAEPILAAAWMTAIDLLIDPIAVKKLGYWDWDRPGIYYGIPTSNFLGWFISSLFIFLVFRRRLESNTLTQLTGISILLFFTLIALAYNFLLAAMIGFALLLLHALVLRMIK